MRIATKVDHFLEICGNPLSKKSEISYACRVENWSSGRILALEFLAYPEKVVRPWSTLDLLVQAVHYGRESDCGCVRVGISRCWCVSPGVCVCVGVSV